MIKRTVIESIMIDFLVDLFDNQQGKRLSPLQEDALHKSLLNFLDAVFNEDQGLDSPVSENPNEKPGSPTEISLR